MTHPSIFSSQENIIRFELLCRYYTQTRKRWDFVPFGNMGNVFLYSIPKKKGLKSVVSGYPNDFTIYDVEKRKGTCCRVKMANESILSKVAKFIVMSDQQDAKASIHSKSTIILEGIDETYLRDSMVEENGDFFMFIKHIIANWISSSALSSAEIKKLSDTSIEESFFSKIATMEDNDYDDFDDHSMTFGEEYYELAWFLVNAHILSLHPQLIDLGWDQYLNEVFNNIEEDIIEEIHEKVGNLKVSDVMRHV